MQIKIETTVAGRHHIDAPRLLRLSIDANRDREWLAPILLKAACELRRHVNIRIDASNLDHRIESQPSSSQDLCSLFTSSLTRMWSHIPVYFPALPATMAFDSASSPDK